eukprot:710917-Pyramimonas_sp.AAC.1
MSMMDSSSEQKSEQNILQILMRRETFPGRDPYCRSSKRAIDTNRGVGCWSETDSLQRCVALYCPLRPAPRSTIAAAFSPDGELLASTQCVLSQPSWQSDNRAHRRTGAVG